MGNQKEKKAANDVKTGVLWGLNRSITSIMVPDSLQNQGTSPKSS